MSTFTPISFRLSFASILGLGSEELVILGVGLLLLLVTVAVILSKKKPKLELNPTILKAQFMVRSLDNQKHIREDLHDIKETLHGNDDTHR